MKKILFVILLIVSISPLFGQSNVKVVEYKILKFEADKKTEFTVPKDQNWRIESIVTRKEDKIEFYIEDDLYILFYEHNIGLSDEFRPFTIPEETKFSIKPINDQIALSITVLKIE